MAEIPAIEVLPELIFAVQAKFVQDVADMRFDSGDRNVQPASDLSIGIAHTNQRRDFLLPGRQGAPMGHFVVIFFSGQRSHSEHGIWRETMFFSNFENSAFEV